MDKCGLSFCLFLQRSEALLLKVFFWADGIHALLTEKKIGREQENELYELIGKVIMFLEFG